MATRLCCIAHDCSDGLIGWPSGMVRWHQVDHSAPARVSPRGLFHEGFPYRVSVRIWRILEFNWRHLVPTRSTRARRLVATCRWNSAEFMSWARDHGGLERSHGDNGGPHPELHWTDN